MDYQRARDIFFGKELTDIYYDNEPVWIQELNDNIATVGFVNKNSTKDVYLEDLYERGLYNNF